MTGAGRKTVWPAEATWIVGAAAVGFSVAYVGTDIFQLERRLFVLAHALVSGAYLVAYARSVGWNWNIPLRGWPIGLVAGGIGAALLMSFVLKQPPSAGPGGVAFMFDLFWLGLVYGTIDVLLLTILPVVLVFRGLSTKHALEGLGGVLIKGAIALLASIFVTVAYHAGFPEFRGHEMAGPVIGNTIVTMAYLIGMSPIAPFMAHIALHLSAVIHAYGTSAPLPPH